MSDGGYIKLWRKLLEWPLWRDGSLAFRSVVITAMLKANWKDEQRFISGRLVHVQRGSLLLPREELAKLAKVTPKQIRAIEALLEQDPGDGQFWALERTPAGTLYSIKKYDLYQGAEGDEGTDSGTGRAPEGHRKGTLLYKKVEEGEEDQSAQKPRSPRKPSGKSKEAVELLQYYHDEMVRRHGIKPALAFGGKDLSTSKVLLSGRPLAAAKALVDAYLDQRGDVEREGWPWAWLPSKLNKLQAQRTFPDIPPVCP